MSHNNNKDTADGLNELRSRIWQGSIPLQIALSPLDCRTYEDSIPYMIQCPRLSYLPFLLPRLHAFFTPALINVETPPHEGWFTFDGVPLKWQHPIGLLYDLFYNGDSTNAHAIGEHKASITREQESVLPWKLTLHYADHPSGQLIPLDADGKVDHDNFINSVKEADFLRNGTGKVMMALSKEDSTKLWQSVQEHDLGAYRAVAYKFYNTGGLELRHIPIKIYLPATAAADPETGGASQATVRVVQGLVAPTVAGKEAQTLGTALHALLPTVFPSRRSYIHAQAVLHGAVVPLAATVRDLMQFASYADGFLHIAVVMVG